MHTTVWWYTLCVTKNHLIFWSKQYVYIMYNNSVPNSRLKHHFQDQPLMLLMEIIPVYSAKRNILRWLLAHLYQFSIRDIQDASPDNRKDGGHLVWGQSRMVDVRNTPINTAATRLPSVGLCGVLAWSFFFFHFVSPLKKHLGGNRCQNDMAVPAGISKTFLSQCTKFCAEGKH